MKRIGRIVGVIAVFLFVSQFVCCELDDRASSTFADMAESRQIKGKTKDFVRSVFGTPSYEIDQGDRTIWVYTPGPACAVWRHECKVGFDARGLAADWSVRSD